MNTVPTLGTQATMAHLIGTQAGRKAYAAYVGLLARAVAQHPAAIGIELMNEPPFFHNHIENDWLFDTLGLLDFTTESLHERKT